jgi:hypothetical protein
MSLIEKVLLTAVILIGLFLAYSIFILAPVALYTQAECLREGYPKYDVSIGLERYCMTFDGVITVRVDKQ